MSAGIEAFEAEQKVTKVTKVVEVTEEVAEFDPHKPLVLRLDAGGARRLGRIILAHAENREPYHGTKTDAFSAELVKVLGLTAENTKPI